jgi:hypothetical protein
VISSLSDALCNANSESSSKYNVITNGSYLTVLHCFTVRILSKTWPVKFKHTAIKYIHLMPEVIIKIATIYLNST